MQGSQRVGKPGKGREFLEARSRSGKDWEFQENYVGSGKGLENKKKRAARAILAVTKSLPVLAFALA